MADQEPRYRLVDPNGNAVGSLYWDGSDVVLEELTNGNNIALKSDGTLSADSASITNAIDVESVSTDELFVGQQILKRVGTIDESARSNVTVDFGGTLSEGEFIWICFSLLDDTTGDSNEYITLSLDGVGSTGDYWWELSDGTSSSSADQIQVTGNNADFRCNTGILEIARTRNSNRTTGEYALSNISLSPTLGPAAIVERGGVKDNTATDSATFSDTKQQNNIDFTASVFRGVLS